MNNMEELFEAFRKKIVQKVLNDYDIDIILTPKNIKKCKTNKAGRPKTNKINKREQKIMEILSKAKKPLYHQDICEALAIAENNYSLKQSVGNTVREMVKKEKIIMKRDEFSHPRFSIKNKEKENGNDFHAQLV